jgi:hypothetical protein
MADDSNNSDTPKEKILRIYEFIDEYLRSSISTIEPTPKTKNGLPFPEECLTLMEKLLYLMTSNALYPKKCKLKKILKTQHQVLRCYLKNAEDPCSFTVYYETVLMTVQREYIENITTDGICYPTCMINKMMQELLKVQESVCCKSKHTHKKEKKHDEKQNNKCTACGHH